MGTNSLVDGYASSDGSDRCFISFEGMSIWFTNSTGYQSYNYGDWTEKFFYYALQSGYTIKGALNQATLVTHDPDDVQSFGQCKLNTGYEMIGYPGAINRMRVWGDGYHEIPR